MDGGAEAYLELGVEKLTVQRYRYRGDELVLERFLMSDAHAALGIFWARGGRNAALPSPARTCRGCPRGPPSPVDRGADLPGGDVRPGEPALREASAGCCCRSPTSRRSPPPDASLDLLPGAQQVPDSLRIIRGPYALDASSPWEKAMCCC